ncbi:MAG: hypothetical protein LBR06_03045, partial [Bacteroidales bacterium]|jgi:uncharacterized protein YfaS (alpha-2-macroglobulin family)|nr:hypothetical protein [Bacteroidales bacterium]
MDSLKAFRHETMFGNLYYADTINSVVVNPIQNTLLAYTLLRADSMAPRQLAKMRNFFLEQRNGGFWQNTYESAKVVETILPDILQNRTNVKKVSLSMSGDTTLLIEKFPFEMKLRPDRKVSVIKTGDFPVYITNYQRFWNPAPLPASGDFEITTSFDADSLTLTAGREVTLTAHVRVKKNADYVMLNIPIPAGCSYADKSQKRGPETHREYFRNETAIFCQHLREGAYEFRVKLIPRYTGAYTLNPAKIELMYFPTFKANDGIKRVRIK